MSSMNMYVAVYVLLLERGPAIPVICGWRKLALLTWEMRKLRQMGTYALSYSGPIEHEASLPPIIDFLLP